MVERWNALEVKMREVRVFVLDFFRSGSARFDDLIDAGVNRGFSRFEIVEAAEALNIRGDQQLGEWWLCRPPNLFAIWWARRAPAPHHYGSAAFDSPKLHTSAQPFISKRAAKVTRSQSRLAQADRLRVLTAEGYTVHVGTSGT
jgi:hypothetical protein